MSTQTVWVVQPVGYDCYGIDGIFDSLEAAKASRPDLEWRETGQGVWESTGACAVSAVGSTIWPDEVKTLESIECE